MLIYAAIFACLWFALQAITNGVLWKRVLTGNTTPYQVKTLDVVGNGIVWAIAWTALLLLTIFSSNPVPFWFIVPAIVFVGFNISLDFSLLVSRRAANSMPRLFWRIWYPVMAIPNALFAAGIIIFYVV